ncbi:MAG: glycosyltransferase [Clostridium sp.]|uniref:glycosyltransferase n=1 Tax=Clostridium sp. TaxID=1506 RepID=UPI002FCAE2F2
MKKIIFMIINMNLGGTEKALLNMIDEIPINDYEITILMLEKYGALLEDIPPYVKVKYLDEYERIRPLINNSPKSVIENHIENREVIKAIKCGIYNIIAKLRGDRTQYYKYLAKRLKVINEEYDIAVAYAGPMEFITYYVLNKINAKEKYQWIHFDIRNIGFNKKFAQNNFKKFDKVVVVSDEGKKALIEVCHKLKGNVSVKLNTIPKRHIIEQSEVGEGFVDTFDGIRILTVGRICKEKGQDIAIRVCKKLLEEGVNVKWYCIGSGNLESEYKNLVYNLGLENSFEFLGSKKNPYAYMRECDIYVQPSRHEGFCITVAEAKIFEKPIITTDFIGAKEQLKELNNSEVVCSEVEMVNSIKKIVNKKY